MVGRQAREAGVDLPWSRLWAELEQVREVVTVYEAKGTRKAPVRQAVWSKLTPTQERLAQVLALRAQKASL